MNILTTIWLGLMMIIAVRNFLVFGYTMRLLKQVSRWARDDINRRLPWKWRYDVLDSVGYFEMIVKFWKPLGSFYPDKAFIRRSK